MHHAEQVFAREPANDPRRMRRHRDRIRVVHEQRAQRRIAGVEQGVADAGHVDRARLVPDQVGPLQRLAVDRIRAARRQQRATGRVAPCADQCGQARRGAHCHAAASVALHAVVETNGGGANGAVVARELHDGACLESCDLRDALRRIFGCALLERVEAKRVARDVVVVEQVLGNEYVHHAQRQRGIGAWQQRQMHVALLGSLAAVGIDGDEFRTASFGLLHAAPEVQVGNDRIRAPDQDQSGMLELLEIGADRCADGRRIASLSGARTDGAVEQ